MWSGSPLLLWPAATAKSLQSCLTLCDPIDGSPPGSPVPGILQARTLEWVAISFSMKVKSESEVAQSCPIPCDPMDCGLPGSSVNLLISLLIPPSHTTLLDVFKKMPAYYYLRTLPSIFLSPPQPKPPIPSSPCLALSIALREAFSHFFL